MPQTWNAWVPHAPPAGRVYPVACAKGYLRCRLAAPLSNTTRPTLLAAQIAPVTRDDRTAGLKTARLQSSGTGEALGEASGEALGEASGEALGDGLDAVRSCPGRGKSNDVNKRASSCS